MALEHTRGDPLLTLSNVNLTLGEGERRRLILRDVDAKIVDIRRAGLRQGQVTGLLGPSGIGKTQLFKIIAGTQAPDDGTVAVGIKQEPPRPGRVGVVTQHYRVFRHLTTLENLVFAGRQGGLSKAAATEQARGYLHRFKLDAQSNLWPGQLSGGQRQRVAILQQVMVGHDFICMDEPFSGLDVNQVEAVARLLCELVSDNELLTIIVVTHDIGAAISVSDTLWLMGREQDHSGQFLDGAKVVTIYDLVGMELAWNPDIREDPRFLELEAQITKRFRTLVPL